MSKIIAFITALITAISALFGNILSGINENTGNDVRFVENIRYGLKTRERMDIAYPDGATGNIDVILYVHGGAWILGSKNEGTEIIKECASNGFIGAALNYTFVSETSHLDTILDEITLALKAIKSDAARRNITVNKYIIEGFSAGAHIATLYAYSRGAESGLTPVAVYEKAGTVAFDDVNILTSMITGGVLADEKYMCEIFSNICGVTITLDNLNTEAVQKALKKYSPTSYIDTAVPTVLVHGELDTAVPHESGEILHEMLDNAGVENYLVIIPASGHSLESDAEEQKLAESYLEGLAYKYMAHAGNVSGDGSR